MPIEVSGRVLDTRGNLIQGARIEVWHADHQGYYDLEGYRVWSSYSNALQTKQFCC